MTKYSAIRTRCASDHLHDSKKEAGRCDDLTAKEAAGVITHLALQPEYPIETNGKRVCIYKADFGYRMADSGLPIVEDVKGMRTPVFNLKKKLVEAFYPGVVVSLWPPVVRKKRKAAVKRKAA